MKAVRYFWDGIAPGRDHLAWPAGSMVRRTELGKRYLPSAHTIMLGPTFFRVLTSDDSRVVWTHVDLDQYMYMGGVDSLCVTFGSTRFERLTGDILRQLARNMRTRPSPNMRTVIHTVNHHVTTIGDGLQDLVPGVLNRIFVALGPVWRSKWETTTIDKTITAIERFVMSHSKTKWEFIGLADRPQPKEDADSKRESMRIEKVIISKLKARAAVLQRLHGNSPEIARRRCFERFAKADTNGMVKVTSRALAEPCSGCECESEYTYHSDLSKLIGQVNRFEEDLSLSVFHVYTQSPQSEACKSIPLLTVPF